MQPPADFKIFEKRRGLFHGTEREKIAVYKGKQYRILFERSDPKRLKTSVLLILKVVATFGMILFFKSFRKEYEMNPILIYSKALNLSPNQSILAEKILSILSSKKFLSPCAFSSDCNEDFLTVGESLMKAKLIGYAPSWLCAIQTKEELCVRDWGYTPGTNTYKKLLKLTPPWLKKLDKPKFSMEEIFTLVKNNFYCQQPQNQQLSEEAYLAFIQDVATFELLKRVPTIGERPHKRLEPIKIYYESLPKKELNTERFIIWRLGCLPTFTEEELKTFRQVVNFRKILFPKPGGLPTRLLNS